VRLKTLNDSTCNSLATPSSSSHSFELLATDAGLLASHQRRDGRGALCSRRMAPLFHVHSRRRPCRLTGPAVMASGSPAFPATTSLAPSSTLLLDQSVVTIGRFQGCRGPPRIPPTRRGISFVRPWQSCSSTALLLRL
jgi:hypothetical protein